jgi:replicative DNA helicase
MVKIANIKTLIKDEIAHITNPSEDSEKLIPSSFYELDKLTGGFETGELIVIGGRPAMGKTAFISSLAMNIAIDQKIPVGIIYLESSVNHLVRRMIIGQSELIGQKLIRQELSDNEHEQLYHKIEELIIAPIKFITEQCTGIDSVLEYVQNLSESGSKVIIIDSMQMIRYSGKLSPHREMEIAYIMQQLKVMANNLDMLIIVTSQLNRSVEYRSSYRPQLSSLKDSGALEEIADKILLLHRPEYYSICEDEMGNSLIGLMEIILAKNRTGGTGDFFLKFDSKILKFSELSKLNNPFDIPGLDDDVELEPPF